MNILAVTSWGGACGIANYADQAIQAIRQADPNLQFEPRAEALDPDWPAINPYGVLWLNYHRGLHSRWTPDRVAGRKAGGAKVVITWHDSFGESQPDDLTKALHDLADVFVVHEPCVGLERAAVIRQGVPAYTRGPDFGVGTENEYFKAWWGQPVLGTAGFHFPWKNFNRLAEVTAECGWAYLVCSNNATDEDEARWKAANPSTLVLRGFRPTQEIVSYLSGCDATCWAYECANSGTSGAIRLGLAARKPTIAWRTRQFRDLTYVDNPAVIRWCSGFNDLPDQLAALPIERCDPGIVALAERDSWVRQGQRYAELFRSLA